MARDDYFTGDTTMADRITIANLRNLAGHMNREMGRPASYNSNAAGEPFSANVGHLHIDSAYGGYALVETVSKGGAERVVLERGSARDLYERMHAFMSGYRAATSATVEG